MAGRLAGLIFARGGAHKAEETMKLRDIKGIGPKTEELLNKVGVFTAGDLLHDYPVGYDECQSPVRISEVRPGSKCAVCGLVKEPPVQRRVRNLTIVSVRISDSSGLLQLSWFNTQYVSKLLQAGHRYVFRGTIHQWKGTPVMSQPQIFTVQRYAEIAGSLIPVYSLTKGLSGKTIAKAVRELLESGAGQQEELRDEALSGNDYLPAAMRKELELCSGREAITSIHFPESAEQVLAARNRLVFDEFFHFILALRMLKAKGEEAENVYPMRAVWETEDVIASLPYRLTGAQLRVWREIESGLSGGRLMSRLVQGDVGSGKTIIAFLALIMTAVNTYQGALMAPTEVLARQHFDNFELLKQQQGLEYLRPVLLTGSVKGAERREALRRIQEGEANVIIGTHALFQEKVAFSRLALVITDEQHRFGVKQRESLAGKGRTPHTLVMSATPIPRTLGVIFYGDLDLSVIDERPKKRKPVKNAVVDISYKDQALRFFRKQMEEGRQVYVICPMIEPAEELELANVTEEAASMRKSFPEFKVGLLHGRMKNEEKNRVMEEFAAGSIQLLVSTTVVEVGVDVPNATVMLIENAERFGLAQLHQLRGRVGRGEYQSYCIFMAGEQSESITQRLSILKESDNGFEIAEKDFALRGPGDLLGIRQSGDMLFRLADLTRDGKILEKAGEVAAAVCREDPELKLEEHAGIRRSLEEYLRADSNAIVL